MNDGQGGDRYDFRAEGHASVGAQIGNNYGTVHLDVPKLGGTPDERFTQARHFLQIDLPDRAASIIADLVHDGYARSFEVAYYWALSVLSGRTYTDLRPEHFDVIKVVRTELDTTKQDTWRGALEVISARFTYVEGVALGNTPAPALFDESSTALAKLDPLRRSELLRHLTMFVGGALQDRDDALVAAAIEYNRMIEDRTGRAWKFFDPDPEPPRPRPRPRIDWTTKGKVKTVIGSVLVALGFISALAVYAASSLPGVIAVLVFLGGGAALTGYTGVHRYAAVARLANQERGHGIAKPHTRYADAPTPQQPSESDEDDDIDLVTMQVEAETRARFDNAVPHLVRLAFTELAPPSNKPKKSQAWRRDTGPIVDAVVREMFEVYRNRVPEPGKILWLIRWRARETKNSWDNDALYAYRQRWKVPAQLHVGFFGGLAITGLGLVLVLAGLRERAGDVLLAAVLLALGGWLLRSAEADRILVLRRRAVLDAHDDAIRLAADRVAFDQWRRVLHDRPSDQEIGNWLAYDKMYVARAARQHYGLRNSDLIRPPIVLTSCDTRKNARRARELGGPPRYSDVIVTLFLLTIDGVREVAYDLDFLTGEVRDPSRMNFSYDSITYAQVQESSIVQGQGTGQQQANTYNGPLVLSQSFVVALVNGRFISIEIEDFREGFLDSLHEDVRARNELALGPSGILDASRVLEAVAVEGRDWIHRERSRNLRMLEYHGRNGGPAALAQLDGYPAKVLELSPIQVEYTDDDASGEPYERTDQGVDGGRK